MKKAMLFIVANLIVISFMGQSNLNRKAFNPGNQGHRDFVLKKPHPGKRPGTLKKPFKLKTKSPDFLFATKQKLDSIVYQEFDSGIDYYKDEFTYNSYGNKTANIGYYIIDDKGGWVPAYKDKYIYGADNMLAEKIGYDYDTLTNQWVNEWKNMYENDASGNMTQIISFHWDGVLGQWDFVLKDEYSYNSNSNLEISSHYTWNFEVGQWYYASKQEYTYDNNNYLVSWLYSVWDNQGSEWKTNSKSEYTNDDEGKLLNELEYSWNAQSGEWELEGKILCDYDGNGRLVTKSFFHWDETASDWVGNYQDEYVYDAEGNVAEFYDHDWDDESGGWVFYGMGSLTFDNSYAFDDLILPFENEEMEDGVNIFTHMLTEAVFSEYNGSSWEDDENVKLYYSSMEVGIRENQQLTATVYPNPATDYVTFRLDNGPQKMQLEIIDMYGKIVLSQELFNGGQVMVQQLKPAFYFYRLIDVNKVVGTGKLSVR